MNKPSIARVEGAAVGLSCDLALGCDLVLATDSATFTQGFTRMALSVDGGGSWLLARHVGLRKAKELVLLGTALPAGEAAAIGLINAAVPPDELDAMVDDWAGRLATRPQTALSLSKGMIDDAFSHTLAEAVEREAVSQIVNVRQPDVAEAAAAFRQRRTPDFSSQRSALNPVAEQTKASHP